MAENPFTSLTPGLRLAPTAANSHSRSHSRSPSRSPERRSQFLDTELDPLLASLSPESTLRALSATDALPSNEQSAQNILSKSIAQVSVSDRALAIRAALAAQKLKEWYTEVLSWKWPQKRDAGLGKGFLRPHAGGMDAGSQTYNSAGENTHLGCLPVSVIRQYEERIEEIRDGMEDLDVEELKEHVLNAHLSYRSRPSSSTSSVSNTLTSIPYVQLSDFTTVITATILQALPYISRLNMLLSKWSVRLTVLRLVPGLLNGLRDAKLGVETALSRLKMGLLPEIDDARFTSASFTSTRRKLEDVVLLAGSRMDRALDALEGREDSLPETWIDEMEAIESGFATWAIEAERRAFANEWKFANPPPDPQPAPTADAKKARPSVEEDRNPANLNDDPQATSNTVDDRNHVPDPAPTNAVEDLPKPSPTPATSGEPYGDDIILTETQRSESLSETDRELARQTSSSSVSSEESARQNDSSIITSNEPGSNSPTAAKTDMEDISSTVAQAATSGSDGAVEQLQLDSEVQENTQPPAYRDGNSPSESPANSANKGNKHRPESLKLGSLSNTHSRQGSTISGSSVDTGYISYGSNVEIKDAEVVESHGTPVVVQSPALRRNSSLPPAQSADGGAEDPKLHHRPVQRSMSLPLERFIEDDHYGDGEANDLGESIRDVGGLTGITSKTELPPVVPRRHSFNPPAGELKGKLRRSFSSFTLSSTSRLSKKALGLHKKHSLRDISTPRLPSLNEGATSAQDETTSISNKRDDFTPSPTSPTFPPRASKRPLRPQNQTNPAVASDGALHTPSPSKKTAFSKQHPSVTTPTHIPGDELEEKITSILNTVPAKIRLAPARDSDASELLAPSHSRYSGRDDVRSPSPTPTRSSTPTPSLYLTPAFSRSRRSHTHSDESSVRLYHLHRGGRAAPLKLFVRTVGEDGERVMVRVGGGWADLGEYLREYVVHHGRRTVSDGRFEVREIASRESPSYVSQTRLAPVPTSGRATPISRPGSALDVRPPSVLNVRKTRRVSATQSSRPSLTAANIQRVSEESESAPFTSSRRRFSVSSTNSMSVASTTTDSPHVSTPPSASNPHSTPLGLAGPKPRARHVSISPESEAWLEDVMGQARKSSSTLKSDKFQNSLRGWQRADNESSAGKNRSVSDIGGSKRVFLRGLEKGRDT